MRNCAARAFLILGQEPPWRYRAARPFVIFGPEPAPFAPTVQAMTTLAVDCMGGDHGPRVTLVACRHFLEAHPEAQLLLVGAPAALASLQHPRARMVAASEVVSMDDSVEVALRRKKDSSMRV